jgi:murein DD-endopeptidase MepM/ murein hydrolase activator NlpD
MINNNQAGSVNLAVLKSMGVFGKASGRMDDRQAHAELTRMENESNVIAALLVSVVKKLAAVDMMLQSQSKMYQYEYNQQQLATRELAIENVAPDATAVGSMGPSGMELIQRTGILGNVLKLTAIAGIASLMSAYDSITKSMGGMFDILGSAASDINESAAGRTPTTPAEQAKERVQQRELRPLQQARPATREKDAEKKEISPRIESEQRVSAPSLAGGAAAAGAAAEMAPQITAPKNRADDILREPDAPDVPPGTPPPSPPPSSPPGSPPSGSPAVPVKPDMTPPKNISDNTHEPVAGAAKGINSGFGRRRDPFTGEFEKHGGVDIRKPLGTPVYAFADGYVYEFRTQNDPPGGGYNGYGKCIRLRHEKLGVDSFYGHLSELSSKISSGAKVSKGDIIGYVGSSGKSTGSHLHFEIRSFGNKKMDPVPWLRGAKQEQISAAPQTRDIQMAALEKQKRTVRSRAATNPNVQLAAVVPPSKNAAPQQRSAVLSAKSVLDDYRDAFGLGEKHSESTSPKQDMVFGFA